MFSPWLLVKTAVYVIPASSQQAPIQTHRSVITVIRAAQLLELPMVLNALLFPEQKCLEQILPVVDLMT